MTDRESKLEGEVRSLYSALAHWRSEVDRNAGEIARLKLEASQARKHQPFEYDPNELSFEDRVKAWVVSRIGPAHMNRRERAMRLLEEATELCQAEGIAFALIQKQVKHVLSRPSGEAQQEAGGVAVCLLGWCAAVDATLHEIALAEILRIEAKPLSEIRGSLARKSDAGLVVCD